MTRVKKWKDPEKKAQILLFNKTVINKLKAYAIETNQSFESVIKTPYEVFQNSLLELSREIDQLRLQTLTQQQPTPIIE